MTIPREISRRAFLRRSLWGGVAMAYALPHRFAWGRTSPDANRLRFAFYTDIHARTEWETPAAMMKAAARLAAEAPAFSIAGGDLITDGFQSGPNAVAPRWDVYMRMHEATKGMVYPVIGNHDLVAARPEDGSPVAEDPRADFKKHMGMDRTYYAFDIAGYHFIVLDSIHVLDGDAPYEGRIDDEQLAWIRADLAQLTPGTPLVLCSHIPLMTAYYIALYGTERAPSPGRVVVNAREVLALFEGHRLLLVLQGHLHVDELIRWKETTFITGGAICAKWWRGPWHGTHEGFGMVTLDGDSVGWEYIDYGWTARRPVDQ